VLQSYGINSCKSILRCQERQSNLVAENARKTFSGRGCAPDPSGELTALPDTLAGGEGDWLPTLQLPPAVGPLDLASPVPPLQNYAPTWFRLATPLNLISATTETCIFLYVDWRLLFLHPSAGSGFSYSGLYLKSS